MADDDTAGRTFSLRRWSNRKRAAKMTDNAAAREDEVAPARSLPPVATAAATGAVEPPAPVAPELPPVESLTMQSDFVPFFKPDVAPALKRAALKKLFADPHFNVMDGLDVYIDDYSKPDPISADLVKQLVQARYIFAPPQTRINELGHVEDVPVEPDPVPAPPPQLAESALAQPRPDVVADVAPPEQFELPLADPDAPAPSLPPGRPKEGDVPLGGTARSAREHK